MSDLDRDTETETYRSPRQRAIEAYEGAGRRTTETLGQAPFLALAGGLAAGALIAALLPRTDSETRLIRPTARRARDAAREAVRAARETGNQRLNELGLTAERGEETIRSLLRDVTNAAKDSAQSALDAAKSRS